MAGPAPTKPQTIDFALEQENDALARLASSIYRLRALLDPILTPEVEGMLQGVEPEREPRSTISATIEDHCRQAEAMIEVVVDLCQRAELVEHAPDAVADPVQRSYETRPAATAPMPG